LSDLAKLALEARKPRVRCEGKNCSCNEHASRQHAFREAATPERILQMLAENVDKGTQLEIALDALELSVGMNTMNEMARTNAIETLRGK
jgi:hypothetical protein